MTTLTLIAALGLLAVTIGAAQGKKAPAPVRVRKQPSQH